ncbi:hypothetical protein NUU61_004089 [Penicillium alfredii]|uniref:Uncharacterized protein n=1 Tax=Penicillium alfredii TaxID=1506179 RepID=A0A9W9KEB1_9EURO|nr:uncharacterized protein NUU61_004089 [Penicillium alfredii]KAJ5101867.1 hypothetical protein NUU61_004089 [Penicillium alfredii]
MADYCWQTQASPTGSQWLSGNGMYDQSTMQDVACAFPRPRHSRVMKPRSAGTSPSSTNRRKMVAQSMIHGLPTQYQSSLEAALLASTARDSRPISWHPSSARTRGLSNPQCMPDFTSENYAAMGAVPDPSMDLIPDYTDENMLSYPMSTALSFSPNGYLPVYPDTQTPSLSMPGSQAEPIAWDVVTSADLSTMSEPPSDGWSLDMLSMTNLPPAETTCPSYASVPSPGEFSGPSTPDFLPIQHFDDDSGPSSETRTEELVGMGLYNQPDGSLAGSALQGPSGKGLKLEETFSPSEKEKEECIDVEGSELDSVPSQPSPGQSMPTAHAVNPVVSKQTSKQALNLLHKSFFFDHDDLDQQAMTAAQPFASLNQPCMSYGYGWI